MQAFSRLSNESGYMRSFLSRGKFAWCWPREARRGSARGPLLPVETLAAQNVAGWTLVKAEAAGGGGPRPAFTRGLASDDDRRPRSVGRDYAHLSLDLSPLP